jgi:hypothetical protein
MFGRTFTTQEQFRQLLPALMLTATVEAGAHELRVTNPPLALPHHARVQSFVPLM